METSDLGFVHRYVPAADGASGPTLLLLHGTGGDETDLLGLGRTLLPGAALLSPRGKVLEGGAARFFRRLAEGVLDIPDLKRRTGELAEFTARSAEAYGFDGDRVIAVGFSNGANIAASLLLLRPQALAAAVLFRSMLPLEPDALPELRGKPVFVGAGRDDPLVPGTQTDALAALLRRAGAEVTVRWQAGGHGLSIGDVRAAGAWLRSSGLAPMGATNRA